MRNDSTPQIETREMSDSDLDGISGGLGVSGGVQIDGLEGLVSQATAAMPALPVGQVLGLVNGAAGSLSGVTGTVAGLTGIAGL